MNLKQLLPFENYILTTCLPVDEVYRRLTGNIEPKQPSRFPILFNNSTKLYEGEIVGDRFRISRIINYRNSFLPVIEGEISPSGGQTQIHIKMKPVIYVLIFMSIWLGIVGIVCINLLLSWLLNIRQILQANLTGFSPMNLVPFAMLIIGYLMTFIGFKTESRKSRKFLAMLLDGEETNQ